jgi:ATP-dependent phosphofructokinase / diphosphate-dependent phosphofructokinase
VRYKNVGILTGGGDAPGLNAVIRSVVKTCAIFGIQPWGIKDGFGGLVENRIVSLCSQDISGILHRGGTILGTTNRDNPFHYPVQREGGITYADMSLQAMRNLEEKGIEALIVIGGDGSLYIANEFHEKYGLPVIGIPKTIDNDLPETERTFGFDTAVSIATEALDRLHTTAESHHRVMILEVMGRYAGWIALHAGIGGGADCILIPEVPYMMESILCKIEERRKQGKLFSIIIVAEGAYPVGGEMTVARVVEGSAEKIRLGGVGNKLAYMIEEQGQLEARCTVLGHLQRGGSPTAYDRVLATRYGVAAVEALKNSKIGCMVALQNDAITCVPIKRVVGNPHSVPINHDLINNGRVIGICFGD